MNSRQPPKPVPDLRAPGLLALAVLCCAGGLWYLQPTVQNRTDWPAGSPGGPVMLPKVLFTLAICLVALAQRARPATALPEGRHSESPAHGPVHAPTYLQYRSRRFGASNEMVEVWLALLVDEVDRLRIPPAWLREARDEWHREATRGASAVRSPASPEHWELDEASYAELIMHSGAGVSAQLDRLLASDEQRDVVLELSERVMRRLRASGPTLRGTGALISGNPVTRFDRDPPTEAFEKLGEYFIKLLRGDLDRAEKDARLF